jgi:hypothetical protein
MIINTESRSVTRPKVAIVRPARGQGPCAAGSLRVGQTQSRRPYLDLGPEEVGADPD